MDLKEVETKRDRMKTQINKYLIKIYVAGIKI